MIQLVRIDQSEPATEEPLQLHLSVSRVIYEDALYLIGEIYECDEHDGELLLSLSPVPPNEGEAVMDVPSILVELVPLD